jgi:hypothetical protein
MPSTPGSQDERLPPPRVCAEEQAFDVADADPGQSPVPGAEERDAHDRAAGRAQAPVAQLDQSRERPRRRAIQLADRDPRRTGRFVSVSELIDDCDEDLLAQIAHQLEIAALALAFDR